jgi:hypothetical protein
MPSHVLLEPVRITREGGDAISTTPTRTFPLRRIVIGPGIASMSDAEIVDM